VKYLLTLFLCLMTLVVGCRSSTRSPSPVLTSINIIDRNGFSETITKSDRLKQYERVDFLREQPYQKVLRVYSRDKQGDIYAYITSYHPNGHPRQYLEVVNNRAFGTYQEWYENGTLKVNTSIIGGDADINTSAEQTWLFEGCSQAWDEEGRLVAEIRYVSGLLEGNSTYFHPNGVVWKQIPFSRGAIHGTEEIFLEDSTLLQTTQYVQGVKQGPSQRYWSCEQLSAEEEYREGRLLTGHYYDRFGALIASIEEGNGYRALFGKSSLRELQQYQSGLLQGEIKVFDECGAIMRTYQVQNGLKHGEEIEFYPPINGQSVPHPQLAINWIEGKIQGLTKTWYANGVQESQRQMVANMKNGLLTAWYMDGTLMLIEEYERDKLVKGEYFMPGEKIAVTTVREGKGIATLCDPYGTLLRRIPYQQGKPVLD
jgi:antitoxin component YwqK of YwqJK toxin-antitoxin module